MIPSGEREVTTATPAMVEAGWRELERQGIALSSWSPPVYLAEVYQVMSLAADGVVVEEAQAEERVQDMFKRALSDTDPIVRSKPITDDHAIRRAAEFLDGEAFAIGVMLGKDPVELPAPATGVLCDQQTQLMNIREIARRLRRMLPDYIRPPASGGSGP